MTIEQVKTLVSELVADGVVYASVAHNIDWAWLETTGIIEEPDDDGHIAIESIAYDFSDCTGGFSHEMTKEEEWELDDAMSASASKYSPLFYPYNMEIL